MSPVTLPSSRTLLLCACAERPRPSYSFFFFRFRCQPEMPPDAGHGKRESAPATIPGCHVWPVFQPSCPAVANRSNGRQDHFQTDAAGGTPATASHARMTMTVAGLPSRRQESGVSPLSVAPPFTPFPWRVAPSHTFPPFPFRLSMCMPMSPCRHSRRHQWSFSLQGQR